MHCCKKLEVVLVLILWKQFNLESLIFILKNYANLTWGQNPSIKSSHYFTEKAWGIISNQPRNNHSGPIFKKVISLNLVIYIINYLSLPIKLTLTE